VAVAENPATAEFLEGLLRAAGIRCMMKSTGPAPSVIGAGVLSTFDVFVLEGDAAAAEAALSDELPARPEQLPAPERRPARRYVRRR
jgi:hypothetical protein